MVPQMLSYVSKDGADFTTTIERDFLTSPQHNRAWETRSNYTCVDELSTFSLQGKLATSVKKVSRVLVNIPAQMSSVQLTRDRGCVKTTGGGLADEDGAERHCDHTLRAPAGPSGQRRRVFGHPAGELDRHGEYRLQHTISERFSG